MFESWLHMDSEPLKKSNCNANPTCAESRVEYWQINALVEKSSLHFLQSCCEAAFFWRQSHFVNENHARRHASMPKVVTTRSNHPRAPLNRLIRLTLGLAKFRKPPTNCASWAKPSNSKRSWSRRV